MICSATTKHGQPCKAHALRGRVPALCSAHSKANTGAGAPTGNQNAKTHGLYAKIFTAEELEAVLSQDVYNLEGELALTRILLRRLTNYLTNDPHSTPELLASVAPVAFTGVRTVAKLLAISRELKGDDDPLKELFSALDELSKRWNIKL